MPTTTVTGCSPQLISLIQLNSEVKLKHRAVISNCQVPKFSDADMNRFETAATLHFTVLMRVMTTQLSPPGR